MPTYTAPRRTYTPSKPRVTPRSTKKNTLDWLDKFLLSAALLGIVGLIALPLLAPKRKSTP
jgi:hypothetical protein